ncbi:MAG: Gx transporter family protein [Clostridia bacterium]|nr:Gx transporter family protein [Clostridia bacterium]
MSTKKIAFLGLSIAIALILSYIESQIPALIAIPGIKVGLPNLIIIVILYKIGWKEAVVVSILRIFLVSLLFGNVQTMTFSLAGATVSLLSMILLRKLGDFSCITVSIVGGVFHNVGQIIAACLWTLTAQVAYYLPVLLVSGTLAGAVIGLISGILVKRLDKIKF